MSADLRCPDCTEPVGPADRFCEVCGKDLLVHRKIGRASCRERVFITV